MTEPEVLTLILDGQKALGEKVDHLGKAVVKLETKVEQLCRERGEAKVDHHSCREEIDAKFREHEAAHLAIAKRLEPIEKLHEQQAGGTRGAGLIWKAIAAVVGLTYIIVSLIVLTNHW
jgi:hypothetical protein